MFIESTFVDHIGEFFACRFEFFLSLLASSFPVQICLASLRSSLPSLGRGVPQKSQKKSLLSPAFRRPPACVRPVLKQYHHYLEHISLSPSASRPPRNLHDFVFFVEFFSCNSSPIGRPQSDLITLFHGMPPPETCFVYSSVFGLQLC